MPNVITLVYHPVTTVWKRRNKADVPGTEVSILQPSTSLVPTTSLIPLGDS